MIAKYALIETGKYPQKVWLNVKYIYLHFRTAVLKLIIFSV